MRQTQHGLPKKTMEKPTGSREKRFAIMRDRCAMHETTQHGRPKIKVNGATRRKRERIKRKAQQRERTKRDKCAMHKTNTAWNNQSRSMVRAITQEQQLDKKKKRKRQRRPQSRRGDACEASPINRVTLRSSGVRTGRPRGWTRAT